MTKFHHIYNFLENVGCRTDINHPISLCKVDHRSIGELTGRVHHPFPHEWWTKKE